MGYKCLKCEDVKECEVPNLPDKIGYVCGLVGESGIDLFEFSDEYLSERVHKVMKTGECEFKDVIIEEGLEGMV
ncbi:MAG: hypothetical protein ISS82_01995 [Nanoarchaeota archaeon]|nr:hypothetical protein [Nanoarchaeota archaeon]